MRAFTKVALIFALSSFVSRAHAQNITGALVQQAEQAIINGITQKVGESLGAGSPLLLDQHTALAQAPDLVDFHPILLKPSARDLARHLPPGDYAVPVTGYCTQYSIHAPGRGLGYKLARVQGTKAAAISALLVQGNLQNISPYTLNADAWRIQAGVPLRQWSSEDQALVHRLIPHHEKELQGDFLQQLQATYDDKSVIKFLGMKKRIPGIPSFEALIGQMGDVGKTVMRMEAARQILTNKTVSAERLPDMLFEPQGDGLPRVLPPSSDPSPSPWAEVQPGVYARYTILDGNMGRNLYEFRVTPDAVRQAKAAPDGAAMPHLMTVASGPAPSAASGPTLGQITGMGDASGEGASLNIGYSIGQGAQALIAVPILSLPDNTNTAPENTCTISNVTFSPENKITLGVPVTFTANVNGMPSGSKITWSGSGVPSGAAGDSIAVTYNTLGSQTVTASCGASTASATVQVDVPMITVVATQGFDTDKTACINDTPQMPAVTFLAQLPQGTDIGIVRFSWYLTMEFTKKGFKIDKKTKKHIPVSLIHGPYRVPNAATKDITGSGEWTPDFLNYVFGQWCGNLWAGGNLKVHVVATFCDHNGNPGATVDGELPEGYSIRGANPDQAKILEYMSSTGKKFPFPNIVAWESTGWHQFNASDNAEIDGWPNWGYGDGWGLSQLELNSSASYARGEEDLWNWKDNLDKGYMVYLGKLASATKRIKAIKDKMAKHPKPDAKPFVYVDRATGVSIDPVSIEAIKEYNSGTYYGYDANSPNGWVVTNHGNSNYVPNVLKALSLRP